ncbi:hypothetical protein A8U91_03837 [Halomonas elongata]|uniref:Uncharacterized protein n=1 Tax=Halomonas elongata TaxID=2746 RepID=A0A1B8NXQ2_HALEL|nr:hypothetical protein A8U91_03837 [Halomonas elongata]
MLIHPFTIGSACTRKSDELPGSHMLVAAVNRVSKVAFLGVLKQEVEELAGRDIVESNLATFELGQHPVPGLFIESRKILAVSLLAVPACRGDPLAIDVSRHQRRLIAEQWRGVLVEGPFHVPVRRVAEPALHLPVDENRNIGLQCPGARTIAWNQAIAGGDDETPLIGIEEDRLVITEVGWRDVGGHRQRHATSHTHRRNHHQGPFDETAARRVFELSAHGVFLLKVLLDHGIQVSPGEYFYSRISASSRWLGRRHVHDGRAPSYAMTHSIRPNI